MDSNCKPWLIEINASPSLTTTNEADKILKKKLIDDVFKIVIPNQAESEKTLEDNHFYVLYDESGEITAKRLNKKQNSSNKIWK